MEENSLGGEKEPLDRAAELAEQGNTDDAQAVLDGIEERNGRWHYVQAQIYIKKNWQNEARKQFEIAVELEPENADYINALNNLEYRAEATKKKKSGNKSYADDMEMGSFCAECCCEGCFAGLCGAACEGCG